MAPLATSSLSISKAHPLPYRAIYGDKRLVPAVPLIVTGPGGKIAVPGLIDSGADNSMFPLAWAAPLGIDKTKCREEDCNTAGGTVKQYIWDAGLDAEIQALGVTIHLNACFSDGLPVVLLGRHDFFQEFRVLIDERALSFTLEKY